MSLKWIMPPSGHLYRSKPMDYISHIINREGKGTLSHYLREKKLCHRLSVTCDKCSMYSVFTLTLVLPHKGSKRTRDILRVVFSYINMLRREGPQKRIFDEIQKIAESKFRYSITLAKNLTI